MDRDEIYPELKAAEWFARLQEPDLPEEELLEWEQWISSSAEHLLAFSQYQGVNKKLGELTEVPLPDETEIAMDDYDGSMPISEWLASQRESKTAEVIALPVPNRQKRWLPKVAAAAVIAVAVLIGVLSPRDSGELQAQVYETAVAEHREISLPDGTQIALGAKSGVSISYSDERRNVVLTKGEALFTVATDASRPFVVLAGNGSTTVLGTVFNVRRYKDRTQVTVTEGRVQVASGAQSGGQIQGKSEAEISNVLIAGQRVSYLTDGQQSEIAHVDESMMTTWQQGYRRYRSEPLKYVVDDINRYTEKEIILMGVSAESLQFTGTVYHDQIDKWISGVADVFGLEVNELEDRAVTLRKK